MTVMKPNSGLEDFVERNRADIDAFEPRLDLWDAIEARLDLPADQEPGDATPTPVVPLNPFSIAPNATSGAPVAEKPAARFGWPRYATAAAVALLLVAGGYGLRRADDQSTDLASADLPTTALTVADQPAGPVFGGPEAMPVSSNSAARRLEKAVKRMETYYGAQISEKKHELDLLDAAAAPGTMPKAADWKQELVAQDSVYRQLRTELFQNPDPNAVLDAMNQNLQIRLDILNQQLRTREQIRQYHDDAYNLAAGK